MWDLVALLLAFIRDCFRSRRAVRFLGVSSADARPVMRAKWLGCGNPVPFHFRRSENPRTMARSWRSAPTFRGFGHSLGLALPYRKLKNCFLAPPKSVDCGASLSRQLLGETTWPCLRKSGRFIRICRIRFSGRRTLIGWRIPRVKLGRASFGLVLKRGLGP